MPDRQTMPNRQTEECDYCTAPASVRVDDSRGYEFAVCCDGCVKFAMHYAFPIGSPECGERHA